VGASQAGDPEFGDRDPRRFPGDPSGVQGVARHQVHGRERAAEGVAGAGGAVVINKAAICDNDARENGVGIAADGNANVTVVHSSITDNHATSVTFGTGNGGGVYNINGATFTVRHSTVSRNNASLNGGGLYNLATLVVENSAITGNTTTGGFGAGFGGGLFNQGARPVRQQPGQQEQRHRHGLGSRWNL
jgi:hypothetical protein